MAPEQDFGTGRLALADSRLAFAAINYGRRWALRRYFGLTGPQADFLSFILAVSAAGATAEALRRAVRHPLGISGSDAVMGAFAVREGALAIAGPAARDTPGFAAAVMFALVGGVAIPGLRRARSNLRAMERRMRSERIRRYQEALAAARGVAS